VRVFGFACVIPLREISFRIFLTSLADVSQKRLVGFRFAE